MTQSRALGLVLMKVSSLQLDDMNLAPRAHPLQVLLAQDRAFPEIGSEVVHQHASSYMRGVDQGAVETDRFH